MKNYKVLLVCLSSIILLGCSNINDEKIEDKDLLIEETTWTETNCDIPNNFKNTVANRHDIEMNGNYLSVDDLSLRNESISNEYIRLIHSFKNYSTSNNIELLYTQPIADRIQRDPTIADSEYTARLNSLCQKGAETVQYYTQGDGLNVDLSISIIDTNHLNEDGNLVSNGTTYHSIASKANCYYKLIYDPAL